MGSILSFWLLGLLGVGSAAYAANREDIDRLTTYAVILGRATGCGIDT
jgi:hypothetical protein